MINKMNIKTGDTVKVITGKNKGKIAKVIAVSPKEGKIIVEGVKMVSKHVKARKAGDQSGIVQAESAFYACKAQIVCPSCKKQTRVAYKVYDNGKKDRICAKCKEIL